MNYIIFVILFGFILLTVPVGVSIGLSGLGTVMITGIGQTSFVVRSMITSLDSFPMLAIPLFLLAGEIFSRGKVTEKLIDLAYLIVGRITGGVPMTVVLACLFFGAMSGSGTANAAAMSTMMYPIMVKMGYGKLFTASLIAGSGALAAIMPPSLIMIVYGISAGVSIGAMFQAGIIPAIVTAAALMLYCYIYCRVKGLTNDKIAYEVNKKRSQIIKDGILPLFAAVIILGGIYGGVFTPTEAAAVAAFYGLIVTMFVYRSVGFKDLYDILVNSGKMIAVVFILITGGTIFSRVLNITRIPYELLEGFIGLQAQAGMFILLFVIIMVIWGMFMEGYAGIIILTPMFLPLAQALSIHPVHFGIIVTMCLVLGHITPPFAGSLFVVSGVTGLSFESLSKAIIPVALVLFVCVLLMAYIPGISMFLPNLLR